MTKLSLTAAFGNYDRTVPLQKGLVRPEGIDLNVLTLAPSEIFLRMSRFQEFDVSEMSMGTHCYLLGTGESPFLGIPAFLSRAFRHAMVYYNVNAGIEKPEDLNGKRIAIREWGMTAVVWIVGILSEEYGLDISSVEWVALKEPRVPIQMPGGTRIHRTSPGEDLSDLLDTGKVDAVLIHQPLACFAEGSPRVQRLFPDYKDREIEYFRRTGVYPIMHAVVLRKDIYAQHRWALRSIYNALIEARRLAMQALSNTQTLSTMLPLLPSAVDETRRIFGSDFWPYGMEANRPTLEKLVTYAHRQGLTPRRLNIEELFGEPVRD
jgi:4,5-dihydroxyphthalate decarboxylase